MGNVYWIGMDYHHETTTLAVLRNMEPDVVAMHTVGSEVNRIMRVLERYAVQGEMQSCYEAGSGGYTLVRALRAHRLSCVVVAPHTVTRSAATSVKKTDRLDAVQLARQLRAGGLQFVAIPTEAQEQVRRWVRYLAVQRQQLRRERTQVTFHLRQLGMTYVGTNWTKRHAQWLGTVTLSALDRVLLDHRRTQITVREQHITDVTAQCVPLVATEGGGELVARLQGLKGIDWLNAAIVWSELWDGPRFPTARALMRYVGLDCREYSSGARQCRGAITKQGNPWCRAVMVQAAACYRRPPTSSGTWAVRRQGLAPNCREIVERADHRLYHRYQRLLHRTGSALKTRVAVARELVGFVWALLQPTPPAVRPA